MYAHLFGFQATPVSPHTEALKAIRAARKEKDSPKPYLLGFGPVARVNPYQSLLYRSFPSQGFAVAPVFEPIRVRDLADLQPLSSGVALHLHWLNWITKSASDVHHARRLGEGYLGRLEQFRRRGGKVLWTVHNLFPHETSVPEVDMEIQQAVAEVADIVHLMSPGSLEALRGIMSLDESKVVYAPHPNYVGAYENYVSPAEARGALGIDADEIVFVVFGALKEYKGLPQLMNAFDILTQKRQGIKYRLIMAGGADKSLEVRDVVHRAMEHPFVLVEPNPVPAPRVQYFLNAADVGLAAYERSLNSGAALLYQSFGLPVIVSDTPVLREAVDPRTAAFVSRRAGLEGLSTVMEQVGTPTSEDERAELLHRISNLSPERISSQFAQDLRRRL